MNRLVLYTVVATFFGGVIFLQASYADVYYHKKVDGKHVYTNLRPSDKGYKKIYTSTSRPRYSSQNYGSKWYSRNYDDLINYYSNVYNLDPELVKAIIKVESNFNSGAVSSKGAIGLMQLMPGTAKDQGVRNPLSPTQNISGGTKYLRKLLDMFNGDLKLALAGYNAGENAVIRYGRSIPPYPETQNYVHKVLYHYSHLKKGDNPPVIKRHVV
ncbi:MAG: transglycosylase SLT domain-containing protein, partial [Candidatus Dadabacteria bacterium]|nr:transglycosylase SLT domain-containing protein [Candidatus Dadabacteria bacterium]NIQ14554.1 transglycosylase SLT domain-containing protein [Candidatus Dadabacteria bacterium]